MSKAQEAGKTASFVVTQLQSLQAGLNKLAEIDRAERASRPDEAKLASVNADRDQLVAKMANASLIDLTQSAEIRASLDVPGGAEHLLNQLVDGAAKEAATAEGQLGESSPAKTASTSGRTPRPRPSEQRYHC